jgi:PPE-repeat protein
MLAAAAAWDMLATELHSAAARYSDHIANLTAEAWRGQAVNSMAAAAAAHIRWLATPAANPQTTAEQARTAVKAYEVAFCATVPPVMIVANRSRIMSLIATNIPGMGGYVRGRARRPPLTPVAASTSITTGWCTPIWVEIFRHPDIASS